MYEVNFNCSKLFQASLRPKVVYFMYDDGEFISTLTREREDTFKGWANNERFTFLSKQIGLNEQTPESLQRESFDSSTIS